jgi:geranylgeranyl diphosphate synthase, type I
MKPPSWTTEIKERVNTRLAGFFAEKRRAAGDLSPKAAELIDELETLTMRGGKRLRADVLTAGFCSISAETDLENVIDACAAIEMLQTYLLVHDDWMDQDQERRGGPSLQYRFREIYADAHLCDSLAVLAGDLAAGYAWELLNRVSFPEGKKRRAFAVYGSMHEAVVFGQQLDLLRHPDVESMYRLKSGSYTVGGPLCLGAILAGADDQQLVDLTRFSEPLGIAFQLRDDLLSTFGERQSQGKRKGGDLRSGKNTLLIAQARKSWPPTDIAILNSVLGKHNASEGEVQRATELLESSGARRAVERRLEQLLDQARDAIKESSLRPAGIAMLGELVQLLGIRDQ